ncbi:hypothetical protein CB0940_07434 [Cercospora beticola]|uniref:AB hydrolase-1 domain-containing protein n=1 Tax=Cercospora beticola TaxID=122368 RepID=A0A2G5H9H5_CERBT|nr:hypothetical protein CB0940_07434 [Cercospora beticola]PIA88882.1 hypothetical protein CB0940_07434 [Cercospora beticola]WPB03381.1 hypothetical protein RHO25_008020 [Cercospora beticola]
MPHEPHRWTIILVPGAWHVDFHCQPPIPFFKDAGYDIVPLPLAAAGDSNSTLEQNISKISQAITTQLERPHQHVAVIFHSASGFLGTEAVNRALVTHHSATERVRIIYLASVLDWTPIVAHLAQGGFLRLDLDAGYFWCDDGYKLYDDMSREDARPFVEALTFQRVIDTPVLSSEAWRKCDLTHVVTTKDKANPLEWQIKMAKDYGMRIAKMETSHCPFISAPEYFVRTIDGVLREGSTSTPVP